MRVLRYAALVALIVWLGGLITLGAIVAPTEPDAARIGVILARFHFAAYGAGAVLLLSLVARRVLGPKPVHFGVRTGILCAMLVLTVYAGFERRYGASMMLVIVTVAAGLVLLGYEAAEG
jgi:hypothetical protein